MKNTKKHSNRETGYYWVKNRTGAWMIAKWWDSLQFWDFMRTIENDTRPPFPVEVDERRIIRPVEIAPVKRVKRVRRVIVKKPIKVVRRRRK